ncbi:MBL fold metallo-hydrolase [Saccharomonospora saliphila]|uniref:MBL fold metallo-hydrolase n=1 Tax=Saccharomonospora saliphila TaxID=369829 RepID=UPI0003639D25|nr:MBL fold metallo-hydrolase [Saccharomonospora saliphila]
MRVGLGLAAVGLGVTATTGVVAAGSGVVTALGGRPDPDRLRTSPRYRDGAFHNPRPAHWVPRGSTLDLLRDMVAARRARRPIGAVPLVAPDTAPERGLHLTWYGHASSLVQLDDTRVLFDPVFSDRASPSRLVGPKRLHPVPHRLDELPRLDAVVISHDHYDHLDMTTVRELARTSEAVFVVPLGVRAHLCAWGVPGERVTELDWGHGTRVGGVWLTATPARHFSGRAFARNTTLWASWVVASARHRVFYSGDTGYIDGFTDIGREHGPFDATLIQVGAYAESWPDIHMTPEQGVATHRDVRGGLLVPVHWGTFTLAPHGWAEPIERVLRAADEHGVPVAVPRPGERIDVTAPPPVRGWWRPHSPDGASTPR